MRFAMMIAAIAALWVQPAAAATWFLEYSAQTTGTFTCFQQSLPQCPTAGSAPVEKEIAGTLVLESFTGTQAVSEQIAGRFAGYAAFVSFDLVSDGAALFGKNFTYSEGGTSGSSNLLWRTSAPDVTVRFANGSAPVPEPATWALLLLGFAATGSAMRRRYVWARAST